MATTVCPRPGCHKPAVLTSSRQIGETYIRELEAWFPVIERRIYCPPPAGCSRDGEVYVVHRVDLFRGTDTKRTVPEYRDRTGRRLCGHDDAEG